jgi:hypothetical protein
MTESLKEGADNGRSLFLPRAANPKSGTNTGAEVIATSRWRGAITGETISKALGGHKVGSGWMDALLHIKIPPLASHFVILAPGKVLVRCHAGCAQEAVFSVLKSNGLWTGNPTTGSGRPLELVWRRVKDGPIPPPHKLSDRISAWNVGELRKARKG